MQGLSYDDAGKPPAAVYRRTPLHCDNGKREYCYQCRRSCPVPRASLTPSIVGKQALPADLGSDPIPLVAMAGSGQAAAPTTDYGHCRTCTHFSMPYDFRLRNGEEEQ